MGNILLNILLWLMPAIGAFCLTAYVLHKDRDEEIERDMRRNNIFH